MFLKSLPSEWEGHSMPSVKLKPPLAFAIEKVNFYSLGVRLKQLLIVPLLTVFYSIQPSTQYTHQSVLQMIVSQHKSK